MVGRGINGRQATTTTRVHAATPQTSTKLTGRHTLLGTRSLFMYIMSNCVAWIDETQRFAGPPEALLPAFHLSPGGREIFRSSPFFIDRNSPVVRSDTTSNISASRKRSVNTSVIEASFETTLWRRKRIPPPPLPVVKSI